VKGDRLRQPGEPDYLVEIGTATWVFAILEWNAAWCCERIQPNCLPEVAERTAGGVARKLLQLAEALPASDERDALIADAERFRELTIVRNGIMHGRPCTHEKKARLSDGDIWTPERLQDTADDFSECSSRLSAHLHGWLVALP
jgi:hypothetical protein